MRFTNVTIPPGSVITAAYLTLRARLSESGTACLTRISAEDVDDAPTFADDLAVFITRWNARTAARVNWDNIPNWTADTNYNSPEIKTVIQEIVDRAGWASGNDIVIFWEDFEDRSTHAVCNRRSAIPYDLTPANAPILHIEYIATYDETAKLQVVLAAQGKTDIQAMAETAKLQVVLAAQGEADGFAYLELGKEQVILAAQGKTDIQAMAETAKLQVVLAAQGKTDIQAMIETAKLQVVLAAQGKTDIQTMLETAKLQVVLAAQGEAEHLTLGELARQQVILAVLGEADQYGFIETGKLQVILAQIGISTVWNIQKARLQGAVRNLPSARELEAL
jgi:hypothetical protein